MLLFMPGLTGMQPPALRTVVALCYVGNAAKLIGRQWDGWDVWICCLAAILLMDPVAILSQSLWLSAAAVAALIFGISGFPVLSGNCRRYCVQLFPSSICNWVSRTSAYAARANRHISWH